MTFAFIDSIEPNELERYRAALPEAEFIAADGRTLPAGLARAEAAAVTWNGPPVDAILAAAPRLRWLHQRGAGVDRILTPRLAASNVVLTNGSGTHAINDGGDRRRRARQRRRRARRGARPA